MKFAIPSMLAAVLALSGCAELAELGITAATSVDLLKRGAIAYVTIKSGQNNVEKILTGIEAYEAFRGERNVPCYMLADINPQFIPVELQVQCGLRP